jgi:transposase
VLRVLVLLAGVVRQHPAQPVPPDAQPAAAGARGEQARRHGRQARHRRVAAGAAPGARLAWPVGRAGALLAGVVDQAPAAGYTQAEVARTLGLARQNVSRWHALWRVGGMEALRSAGPTGYAPRLDDPQLHVIDQALRQGARAHSFDSDHWTLARVASMIERLTGVAYHRGHVWKLLRYRLHYRLLRPARRAVERDERAIARWVAEDWP